MADPISDVHVAKAVVSAARASKQASAMLGRQSIVRKAKPGIYQFPVMMSSNISTDEAIPIARAIEKLFASITVTAYSLNPFMDSKKFENVSDYVQSFHRNDNSSINAGGIASIMESLGVDGWDDETLSAAIESVSISTDPEYADMGKEAWDIVEEQLNGALLNDDYLPFKKTLATIQTKLTTAKAAMEASTTNGTNASYSNLNTVQRVGLSTDEFLKNSNDTTTRSIINSGDKVKSVGVDGGSIVKNDKLTDLEPTMINVTIVVKSKDGKSNYPIKVNLGIKAMIRMVRSDVMISTMCAAVSSSRLIFRFVKWTKGELSFFKDFILNSTEIKERAIGNNTFEAKVMQSSMKRKKKAGILRKMTSNDYQPNLTIILSSYEVEKIADITGVDLKQVHHALALMNKYFLLTFGIYDEGTGIFSYILDSDDDFTHTTLSALKASASKSTNDLDSINAILSTIGRYNR